MASVWEAMMRCRLKKMQRCITYSGCKIVAISDVLAWTVRYDRYEAAVILLNAGARADWPRQHIDNRSAMHRPPMMADA